MNTRLENWEKKLKIILDQIDDYLEDLYGHKYNLHPSRAKRGHTANKSHDGLFNVKSGFTAGFGSKLGKGYIIDVQFSTLENIPNDLKIEIKNKVINMLNVELSISFPNKNLLAELEENKIKIHGDLSL